jgi:hypothetical protein
MEPLVALGIASNIVQIVDFAGRILSRSKEISTSGNGSLAIHSHLVDVARNLRELSNELSEEAPGPTALKVASSKKTLRKDEKRFGRSRKNHSNNVADDQIIVDGTKKTFAQSNARKKEEEIKQTTERKAHEDLEAQSTMTETDRQQRSTAER